MSAAQGQLGAAEESLREALLTLWGAYHHDASEARLAARELASVLRAAGDADGAAGFDEAALH